MNLIRIKGISASGLLQAKNRPKMRIGWTMFDLIIEITGLIAVLSMWLIVLLIYFKLPEIIPTHYDITGAVDGFGNKTFILLLAAITTIIFAGMTVLNRFPHVFNYIVKITENNAFVQYMLACRMIRCLKFAIVLLFDLLVIQTIRIAEGKVDSFSAWFIYLALGVIFLIVIYFMVKSFIYR